MFSPSSFSPTTSDCQLAKLTFLENPSPWEEEKYIYVDIKASRTLNMICRWVNITTITEVF